MEQVGDLLVFAPDTPHVAMVVEVKRILHNRAAAENQLKRYMLAGRCAVALLVTSDRAWLYRNTFADEADDMISTVGEFATGSLLGLDEASASEGNLERLVFEWLERLAASGLVGMSQSDEVRAAVLDYVIPAVSEGRVVYGHAA